MNLNSIVFILTIFLIILYLNYPEQIKQVEKMEVDLKKLNIDAVIPFDDIKIPSVPIPKLLLVQPGQTFELLDLPYCEEKFKVEYGSNTNNIINDNKKIYQDMIKPYEQNAFIGEEKQGLTQISWKKSFFTYNGRKVPLELHFAHFNPQNGKKMRVIFPLSLSSIDTYKEEDEDEEEIEGFANVDKAKKLKSKLKNIINTKSKEKSKAKGSKNFADLNKLGRLNMLLKKQNDVPPLVKGQVNTGKLLTFDLCEPSKLLLEQKKFFFAETPNEELLLIAKPQEFDRIVGLTIINNLQDPDYEIIKPAPK